MQKVPIISIYQSTIHENKWNTTKKTYYQRLEIKQFLGSAIPLDGDINDQTRFNIIY
jgi:hypothetical protein